MSQRPLPVPWRKSPRNSLSPDIGSSFENTKKKVLDPWIILEHLFSGDSKVREYCVQQLYEINNWEDLDYFLPQLCSIILSIDWRLSHSLRLFLLRKCIDSLHFSLRTYWFLHACSEYCKNDQKLKCEKLWQQVEITVVNSALPRSVLENHPLSPQNMPPVIGSSTKLSSNEMDQRGMQKQKKSSSDAEQQRHLLQPSPSWTPSLNNQVNDPEINVLSLTPEIPKEDCSTAKSNEWKDENQIAATEQQFGNNKHYEELKKEDRDVFLYKQRRCAFFNAQLDLVHFLEGVAGALKPHKPEFRREVLRKNLEHANSVLPSGLYFPIGLRSSKPHSSILRIIPESNVVLDSNDKVPFLFHYEVRINDYPRFSNRISGQLQDECNPQLQSRPIVEENAHMAESKGMSESPLAKRHASPRSIPLLMASNSSDDAVSNSLVMGSPALSPQSAQIKEKELERDREMGKKMKKIIISEKAIGQRKKKRERIKSAKKRSKVSFKMWKRKIKSPFPVPWQETVQKYQQQSVLYPNVGKKGWMAEGLIFKAGDDLRQEALAMQFICLFQSIFEDANLPIKLSPFTIQVTSPFSGFVEVVKNSVSLSNLKMKVDGYTTLAAFWEDYFGPRSSKGYTIAIRNFVESLAGYSLVCYFLQLKDRHNGNILLDSTGRICHIDYGFMLSNSPGGNMGFESSPFKFQEDFITLLGGEEQESEHYSYFQLLMIRGFLEARKHVRKFCLLARIMFRGSHMGCFVNGEQTILDLRDRFLPDASHDQVITKVMELIEESSCNWRTTQYDNLQRITNGIL